LKKVTKTSEKVSAVKRAKQRRLHKAFLRYHDPDNWPLLREALKRMGRADLIGNGKKHLVPSWQPKGTGDNRRADKRGKDLHHRISVRERAKPGRGRKPSTRR
jgi:hypothetical protein